MGSDWCWRDDRDVLNTEFTSRSRSYWLLQDVTQSVLLTFLWLWCENKNNIDFDRERERLHAPPAASSTYSDTPQILQHNTHPVASISVCVCAVVTLNASSAYRCVGRVCVDGPPSVDLFHWANTSRKTFNTATLFTSNLWVIFTWQNTRLLFHRCDYHPINTEQQRGVKPMCQDIRMSETMRSLRY